MILLDPDLGPTPPPAPRRVAAKSPTAAKTDPDRLPSVRSLSDFLRRAQTAVRLRGQVSVLLTGDEQMQRLNRQFRGKNKTTDVLSFPAEPGPEKLAGDLAISVPTARAQAAQQGHALRVEIKVLMLHGLLHLAGYDHETDSGQMARREQKLRGELGLPLGLIERAGGPTLSPEKRRKDGARNGRGRIGKAEVPTLSPEKKRKDGARSGRGRIGKAEVPTLSPEKKRKDGARSGRGGIGKAEDDPTLSPEKRRKDGARSAVRNGARRGRKP